MLPVGDDPLSHAKLHLHSEVLIGVVGKAMLRRGNLCKLALL